ncbi:YolD-like family protein [Oceanivirga miroungae]|uniref:YolD-like protein n=1 Tax=Oceanivirga miroungae TaxID=1130046 RepID=A0A6I8M7M5_9FUSO|nr:YolD-like family protein [Oceanivirga miroungae]VWL85468.1 hypothetical protein OMES3154_00753 [Oceanivirga miroungae]
MSKYDKYINLSRPLSKKEKMPIIKRAAQFMSFDALEGFKTDIRKKGIVLDEKILLSDEEIEKINSFLYYLTRNKDLLINICYYDKGYIKEISNKKVKKINTYENYLILEDLEKINFNDIVDINIVE